MFRSFGSRSLTTLAADAQLALGDVLEAHDHCEQRRLPAARRADEDEELAVADGEVGLVDGSLPSGTAW